MLLSLPTFEVIDALRGHKIVECGAGSGLWLRVLREAGFDVVGLDPAPNWTWAKDVVVGTHSHLGRYRDRLLLTVWPPDGVDLNEWVQAWGGRHFAFVGEAARVTMPDGFDERTRILLPGGDKDRSTFYMGLIQ